MEVLITGASGFVGKNVLLALPADWRVTALYRNDETFPEFVREHRPATRAVRCDLNDAAAVQQFAQSKFDVCLYLAANSDPRLAVQQPLFDFDMNARALVSLLSSGVHIRRLIFFSSGAVYEGNAGPVSPATLLQPTTPYAISKAAAERYTMFFQQHGVLDEYVIVRFFGCYGPYEPERKVYRKLVETFGVRGQREFVLYGDGNNCIYAMYVDDAVQGILAMMRGKAKNVVVDFCGPESYTLRALVERTAAVFGIEPIITLTGGTPAEAHRFTVDNDAMLKHFSFTPSVRLEEGLRRYKERTYG